MKSWPAMIAGLSCALLLLSCRKGTNSGAAPAGPPHAGATYSLSDGEGGFRAAKIVAVEDEVVFVTLFGERWASRPQLAEIRKAGRSTPVAYLSASFAGMQPLQLESGSVSAEELEAYELWKKSRRDVF